MPKLTKKNPLHTDGWTDPNYRKASLLKIVHYLKINILKDVRTNPNHRKASLLKIIPYLKLN